MAAHVAFAEAAYAMRIDGQNPSLKMARTHAAAPKAARKRWLSSTVRSARSSWMAISVARNGRPLATSKMCWFKPWRRRGAGDADCRLVDELPSQPRLHAFRTFPGPNPIPPGPRHPGVAARDQQPLAGQVSAGLLGEKLSNSILDAPRIAWHGFGACLGDLSFHRGWKQRAAAIEFFFEGQSG